MSDKRLVTVSGAESDAIANAILTFVIDGREWLAAAYVGPLTSDAGTIDFESIVDRPVVLRTFKAVIQRATGSGS